MEKKKAKELCINASRYLIGSIIAYVLSQILISLEPYIPGMLFQGIFLILLSIIGGLSVGVAVISVLILIIGVIIYLLAKDDDQKKDR